MITRDSRPSSGDGGGGPHDGSLDGGGPHDGSLDGGGLDGGGLDGGGSDHGGVEWRVGAAAEFGELAALVRRCLDRDGGLPLAVEDGFLRSRWLGERTTGIQARDGGGVLVAAGAVRPGPGGDGAVFGGLVDPAWRGAGLGGQLLDRGLEAARGWGGAVVVETESWSRAAEELFVSRGLRRIFLEDVMRFDLAADGTVVGAATAGSEDPGRPAGNRPAGTGPGEDDRPVGMGLEDWDGAGAARFFAVYEAAFRERPGFPGWSAGRWVEETVDEDFRPGWSLLATLPGIGDAGFVTAADGWIVQVGVVPAARGRGVGAALIGEALRRMRADGAAEVWLDVNVDNRAGDLYRRLGFEHRGRRGRYAMDLGS